MPSRSAYLASWTRGVGLPLAWGLTRGVVPPGPDTRPDALLAPPLPSMEGRTSGLPPLMACSRSISEGPKRLRWTNRGGKGDRAR